MNKLKRVLLFIGVAFINVYLSAADDVAADSAVRSPVFVMEKNAGWEPAGDGVKRQILGYDGRVMLVKVKFEKGAVGTPHSHPHTQTTYVASGKFEFTVGDETMTVGAGDGVYMEPGILHGCVCLEPGILVDCFAPMRADFLKN